MDLLFIVPAAPAAGARSAGRPPAAPRSPGRPRCGPQSALQAADAVQVDNSGLADPEIAQLSIPPLQLRQGEGRLIKGRGGIEKGMFVHTLTVERLIRAEQDDLPVFIPYAQLLKAGAHQRQDAEHLLIQPGAAQDHLVFQHGCVFHPHFHRKTSLLCEHTRTGTPEQARSRQDAIWGRQPASRPNFAGIQRNLSGIRFAFF